MADHTTRAVEASSFAISSSYNDSLTNRGTSSSTSSSTNTTPSQTPTQELTSSSLKLTPPSPISTSATASTSADQTRGRPRYKRQQPSRRYFTPPSRMPSPVRQDFQLENPQHFYSTTPALDFQLEVESAPQDPDIFADAETDYFSSTDRNDGPRAYRRHFFDAVPAIDGQQIGQRDVGTSIAARLALK